MDATKTYATSSLVLLAAVLWLLAGMEKCTGTLFRFYGLSLECQKELICGQG